MKTASWLLSSERKASLFTFVTSPYLAVRSLNFHHCKDESTVIRFITFAFLTSTWIILAKEFLNPLSLLEIIIFAPAIYFLTELLGAFGQLLFFNRKTYSIHRSPLSATSLSHFWGRDWNLWVQDWLRDVSHKAGKNHHKKRIIIVFLVSGLFHELMCNLPYWIVYKKSYFGTMIGYFLIQALLLWIDKKFISHLPSVYRRIYMWLAVILPSPLFINVPLLTFFGLDHG